MYQMSMSNDIVCIGESGIVESILPDVVSPESVHLLQSEMEDEVSQTQFQTSTESPHHIQVSEGLDSGNRETEFLNMNHSGIITYMTFEEARAKGLIHEDTQEENGGDGMTYGTYAGDDTDTQLMFQEEGYEMEDIVLTNPFTNYTKGVVPQDTGRNRIPIRKPTGGASRAAPQNTNGTEQDLAHPFVCDLCSEKFKKKLFLNNHMESRHGIKFVFTEKGKKVKLVRMPTQLMEGEKLDPCVRLLLDANGNNSGNVIGVQPVETVGEQNMQSRNPTAHEVDPFDILQGKISAPMEKDFGCAILMEPIRTFAMKAAKERGQTPFVAYRPYRSQKLYLLAITNFSKNVQLLTPATEDDLENAEGIVKEPGYFYTEKKTGKSQVKKEEGSPEGTEIEGPGPSSQLIRNPTTKFSHIAIVLYVEQVMNESQELIFKYEARKITEPVAIMKFDDFARTMVKSKSKPKRLRCLSMPVQAPTPSCAEESIQIPKRKYTRRSFGRRSSAFGETTRHTLQKARPTADLVSETPNEPKEPNENDEKRTPSASGLKRKRGDDDDEFSDDEEADATYVPYRANGSAKRGRGRPRKN